MRTKTGDWPKLRWLLDEEGQTLPWMALLLVLFAGMGGLSTDLGRAYVCYHELQSSTDAAALAGAYEMSSLTATSDTVKAAVTNFSSATGGTNATPNLPGVQVSTTLKCLKSVTIACSTSSTQSNALQVTQSVAIPTYFIRALSVFGVSAAKSMTIKATATAAMRGAVNAPYNVAIIIDTTASMQSSDNDAACKSTRIKCALTGARVMLQQLSPCAPSTTGSGCPVFDQVSLFTYPNVEADTAPQNKSCPGTPKVMSYSVPGAGGTWTSTDFSSKSPTYQLTDYLNNYSSTYSANGPLSTSSQLGIDTGAKSGCSGMQAKGGVGTYFAAVIYAAQSSLLAAQAKNKGSLNAMIILSDGDADSSDITGAQHNSKADKDKVIYGSFDNQCQQAIAAANYATTSGTKVYTVAYGAANSGCGSDTSGPQKGISPCQTMRQMASTNAYFFSDASATLNKGQCIADTGDLSLVDIFQRVAYDWTYAQLIPNSAT